jgi:hypothetical protein
LLDIPYNTFADGVAVPAVSLARCHHLPSPLANISIFANDGSRHLVLCPSAASRTFCFAAVYAIAECSELSS